MEAYEVNVLHRLTPCRADSVEMLSEALAEVHAEFIVIHPFREGNGRMGRWITELMALQTGFPAPDHGFAGARGPELRHEYYAAMRSALVRADYSALAVHFAEALRRGERSFRTSRRI
jgi:cell filamentation protein